MRALFCFFLLLVSLRLHAGPPEAANLSGTFHIKHQHLPEAHFNVGYAGEVKFWADDILCEGEAYREGVAYFMDLYCENGSRLPFTLYLERYEPGPEFMADLYVDGREYRDARVSGH